MRIVVDFDVCASTGTCAQICPEVFEVRSDGYLYILIEEPDETLRAQVVEAAEALAEPLVGLVEKRGERCSVSLATELRHGQSLLRSGFCPLL